MSKERVLTPATPTMSTDTRRISSTSEKTGPAEQTSKGAWTNYMENEAGRKAWPWRTG
jgi:hypothetical protein